MRDFLTWVRYNLWYFRNPPWDRGISPPELVEFIRQHPAGKALDLGCGSGTNILTLAQAGWQVTGVDFAVRAVAQARRKLTQAGLDGVVLRRDVTDLDDLPAGFDLVLDIGCYHSLPAEKKARYEANLQRLLAERGWFLLYGMLKSDGRQIGLSADDIRRLSDGLELIHRSDGFDRGVRPSTWLTFHRRIGLQ